MPRPQTLPVPACPKPGHEGSHVSAEGFRELTDGTLRPRFRCVPTEGAAHRFSLKEQGPSVRDVSVPPVCIEHPGSVVELDREYASSPRRPRQLYACTPEDDEPHTFTPALPREHVHAGVDDCAVCEELRGIHHGDQAVARRHSWTAHQVAEGLRSLSEGKSYGSVSRAARTATKRTRTRRGSGSAILTSPAPTRGPQLRGAERRGTRLARNSWHIAADWCETFAPVLWRAVDDELREDDLAARARNDALLAAGQVLREPQVLMLDDIPINAKVGATSSRRDWFVLVASQVTWHERHDAPPGALPESGQRLRVVRGFPSDDHYAWKLLLAELGYRPDFVVADAGKGLGKAVAEFWQGTVPLIPSLWHMRRAIEGGLLDKTPGAWTQERRGGRKVLLEDLERHLRGLRRKDLTRLTAADWTAWWDDLLAELRAQRLPLEATLERRTNYEALIAGLLPVFAAYPQLPLATGGLEFAIRQVVEPMLTNRARVFANIERTNALLDLAVCADHGLFLDMRRVVTLLREDSAADFYGWATPLRSVTDPHPLDPFAPAPAPGKAPKRVRYSSLRDQQLLRSRTARH